ncbi:hypothetical protein XI25_05535 [Paenibacillus sp. DMB20]|nr:hypothetical protein XI25_05535 [Paenibacillus sp. DMB20]
MYPIAVYGDKPQYDRKRHPHLNVIPSYGKQARFFGFCPQKNAVVFQEGQTAFWGSMKSYAF